MIVILNSPFVFFQSLQLTQKVVKCGSLDESLVIHLARVAQWIEHLLAEQRVACSSRAAGAYKKITEKLDVREC